MPARKVLLLLTGALIAISGQLAPCQICTIQPTAPVPLRAVSPQQMPAYEVATIKPWDGNGFATPLRIYIQRAFGLSPNIVGSVIGPDWINSARYVIQGKPPDSIRDAMQTMTTAERTNETALMQQALLANRFQLKAHFETREMPVYELVLAKGGSESSPRIPIRPSDGSLQTRPSIRATAMPIHNLIDILECAADIGGREVIDKTGLTGTYDFSLKWTPLQTTPAPGGGNGPAPPPGCGRRLTIHRD